MSGRAREAIAPLYLLACLLLGNGQNGWALMALQLAGLALLAWAALEPDSYPLGRAARQLLMIAGIALVVIALQLVPLSLSAWQHLGGRQGLAADYRMLGLRISTLPLSLTPYETLGDSLKLIPPLAMACAIVRLRAYRPMWLAAALLAGSAASIVLGALHLAGGDLAAPVFGTASPMAILAALSLPFAVAAFVSARGAWRQPKAPMMAALAISVLIMLAGATVDHSFAKIGLALSVLLASLLLVARIAPRRPSLLVAGTLVAATAAFFSMAVIDQQDRGHGIGPGIGGRVEVLRTAAHATGDFMPFGSGLGSFQSVYRLYENPDDIAVVNVAHAHDDYLEIALEMGLPGILLMVALLSWWRVACVRAWREPDVAPFARAAAISSALVLADSLVGFPLRTAAISTVFGMCLALLADRRVRSQSELWPTRHVVLK